MFIQVGPSGIAGLNGKNNFSVYPNPAMNGKFTITFTKNSDYAVTVLSGTGTPLVSLKTDTQKLDLNLPGLNTGLYFIQVMDQATGLINTQKLIIQ